VDDGDTSFDYDMYNGLVYVKGVVHVEPHGIHRAPTFVRGAGSFTLAAASPGLDKGQRIPNFTDGYHGAAPDVGAQERGAAALRFGPSALKPGRRR
jgi:hypothetical protein